DNICLKAPVDAKEEEFLLECLKLLTSRPEVGRALGERARAWAQRECNWDLSARRYAEFLSAVVEGREALLPEPASIESAPRVPADYIASWTAPEDESRAYVEAHRARLEKTLALTPRGGAGDRVLEMGAYLNITPALKTRLGYGEVRGCYYGPLGNTNQCVARSEQGEEFGCDIDLFDAEKDRFPYPDGHFSTVLCCEIIEHLPADPMHMMGEINRILKSGGTLVLTTPNIASLRGASAVLQGFNPMLFSSYVRPGVNAKLEARHNREYTPREVKDLLENCGFEVAVLETGPFREQPTPELAWVEHLLDRYILPLEHRGDGIYAVGRKTGSVRERYPTWLYS
ncbi:MAG: methyltransferase domain-containing protein, partial [Bryobacteraceae bacterium]